MRRLWWLVAPAVVIAACGGGGDDGASSATDAAAVATDPAAQAVERTTTEAPAAGSTDSDQAAAQSATGDPAAYDPDAIDQRNLLFWDSLTGEGFLTAPDVQLAALDRLATSGHPGADKYLVDLANVPTPYALRIIEHLRVRFDRPDARTLSDFPEMALLPESDTQHPNYLQFKQQLFGSIDPKFAIFLSRRFERTLDAREVRYGGVGVDVIPPLEFPGYVSADEASAWLNADDEVVGVSIEGDVRAFPVRIIGWHEMLNDTIGGIPVSLAYCTLCGSAIVYDGRLNGELYRFGTSGLLYRSNKLMYDRTTDTLWNQFTGQPAWGPLAGQGIRLTAIASTYTTWGEWLAANPETSVLDINTGFPFDYSPGAAYASYNNSPDLIFQVPVTDDRLAQKDEVFVVTEGDALIAFPVTTLAEESIVNETLGPRPIVAIATPDGMGGRAFERGDREFVAADLAAAVVTDDTGQTWTISESALRSAGGESLARINGSNAFWFAVANLVPDARLYEGD